MRRLIFYMMLLLFCNIRTCAQLGFQGVYNGKNTTIVVNPDAELYINGSIINAQASDLNIANFGVITLKDSVVNLAGTLFNESSSAFVNGKITSLGTVHFINEKPQYICNKGEKILFADLKVADTTVLLSDIHVSGNLILNNRAKTKIILNNQNLRMYDRDDPMDLLISGRIVGEDENHYIADVGTGSIRMIKRYGFSSNIGIVALQDIGLEAAANNATAYIKANRLHQPINSVASGSIAKYYEILNKAGDFDRFSMQYFTHDLLPKHGNPASFQIFYADTANTFIWTKINAVSENSQVKILNPFQDGEKPQLYTIAEDCSLIGLNLGMDVEVCRGKEISINPQWDSLEPLHYYYVWNSDTNQIEGKNISHLKTFIAEKDTIIYLKAVDNHACEAYDTMRIVVRDNPYVKIKNIPKEEKLQCITHEWAFSVDSIENNVLYTWNLGDDTIQKGKEIQHTYNYDGAFNVSLSVENQYGCENMDSIRIIVEAMPVPHFIMKNLAEKRIRFTDSTQFFTPENNQTWKILSTTYFLSSTITVDFPDFGEYPLILTTWGERCTTSITQNINVLPKGRIEFQIDSSAFCSENSLQFRNTSVCNWGAVQYEWDFGDGTRGVDTNPVKIYHNDETATYSVTLRAFDPENGWNKEFSKQIIIHRLPYIGFGDSIITCENKWILRPVEPGLKYRWNDVSIADSLLVAQDGRYSLQLTDVHGCVSYEEVRIKLEAPMDPTIDTVSACGNLLLDAGNPNSIYLWNNGTTDRTLQINQSGTYQVNIAQYNGCKPSKIIHVTIYPLPYAKIQVSDILCDGDTISLMTVEESERLYVWNTGDTNASICITQQNMYCVTAIDTQTECRTSDSAFIIKHEKPKIDLGSDRNICIGQEHFLKIDEYPYASSIVWWDQNGFSQEGREYMLNDTGTYFVELYLSNGCSASDHIHFIQYVDPLTVDFLVASDAFVGDTLCFIDLSYPDPTIWNWNLSSGFRISQPKFQYVFWNVGKYDAELIVQNADCQLSKTKQILISQLKTPNKDTLREDTIPKEEIVFSKYSGDMANILSAKAIPNPSSGQFDLAVVLRQASKITAKLYNLSGEELRSILIPKQKEYLNVNCDFRQLQSGVYFLKLNDGKGEKTVKIIIH